MLKVSIIIPYYKKKFFLNKTINSILKQTFKNFEVIIIYDNQDKQELSFVKKISNKDKRIKLIINKRNLGAGISRNIGIKNSSGKYISFLDADDIWKKNKLKKQIEFMEKNNYTITHTTYQILQEQKIVSLRIARTFSSLSELIHSCDIGLSTVVVKRDIFKKDIKFPNLKTKEDFVLWLKILKKGYVIYPLKKNLVTWVKTKNSLSSSLIQKLKDSFSLYNHYMGYSFLKSLYFTIILSINFLKKIL